MHRLQPTRNRTRILSLIVCVLFSVGILSNSQAAVYIDADGVIGTPETTLSVTSGTTVTLVGVFALPTAGIVPFDTVGMTMSYAGTATAMHGGASPKAGPLSGFGGGAAPPAGPSIDLAGFGPGAFPGSTLTTTSPGGAGFVDSAGYFDPASAADFMGVATPPFAAAPMDIMGWDFTITGPVSSTVTFAPGPGLDGTGFPALGGGTLTFFDTETASGFSPAAFSGITITIVPEPSVPLLLGVAGLFGIAVRRRRNCRI